MYCYAMNYWKAPQGLILTARENFLTGVAKNQIQLEIKGGSMGGYLVNGKVNANPTHDNFHELAVLGGMGVRDRRGE